MNSRILNVFFRFYIEWNFATAILLTLHLLSSQHFPLFAIMGMAGASSLVLAILLENSGNLGKLMYVTLIMPLLILAGFLAGIQIFYTMVMALFIFWRTLHFHQEASSNSESIWLVLTFLVGVFLSPLASYYGGVYLKQLAFLLIFQLLFILAGQFLLKWLDTNISAKRKFALDFSKLLGLSLVLVTVITLGRNIIKEIFFFALQGIGLILSFLLYPLFSWIASPAMQERAGELFAKQDRVEPYKSPFENAKQVFDPDFWGPILFAVIGIIIFYIIYKKSSLFKREPEAAATPSGFVTASELNDSLYNGRLYKRRLDVPTNQIRKEIFQLEKFAHKKDFGRFSHESIDEWFERLGIHYDRRIVQTYENVRYGECGDGYIENWFKEEIKNIKNQVNTLQKERKQENNQGLKDKLKNAFKK